MTHSAFDAFGGPLRTLRMASLGEGATLLLLASFIPFGALFVGGEFKSRAVRA